MNDFIRFFAYAKKQIILNKNSTVVHLWQQVKRDFSRIFTFAIVFGLVKLSGFSAAILLSNLATLDNYAIFEFAIAGGLMLAIPLNVGMQGAYPYFKLRLGKKGYVSIFYFHALVVVGTLFMVLLFDFFWLNYLPIKVRMILIMAGLLAMQMLGSTILKSHERIVKAVLVDGGIFLVLNFYLFYLYSQKATFQFHEFYTILLIYLGGFLCFFGVQFFKRLYDFSMTSYRNALAYGRHLVLSSVLIIGLTNGARIFVEVFIDSESLAYYAFYLRFALIILMIQQVFLITFFKKIYQTAPATLDRYFAILLGVLCCLALLIWWTIPLVFSPYLSLLHNSIDQYQDLFYLLCFHSIFWAALAFNENIIHREKLSLQMNLRFSALLFIMLSTLLVWSKWGQLNVQQLSFVNLIALFIAIELQFFILKKHRSIDFKHTKTLLRFSLSFFTVSYLWIF